MRIEKILVIGLAFTMLFSMNVIVCQVEADDLPPSITFSYSNRQITVTSADSGYHYSGSSSGDDANLIFVRDNDNYTFYHYVGGNMSVVTSGAATTEEIYAGDSISGFSEGWWSIYWKPYGSGYSYMSFYVSESSGGGTPAPNITFSYSNRQITITSVESGLHYSDSSSGDDANLIFVRDNDTFYHYVSDVYGNATPLRVATSGSSASTKEIEAGDTISGFSDGWWSIYWKPHGSGFYYVRFHVSEFNPPSSPPNITFVYDDISKEVTITSADSGYHYSDSSSGDNANLIFVRDNDTFYRHVGINMSVVTSGAATTKEIEAGDTISGFSEGWWKIYWMPYGSGFYYFRFYVSESPPSQTGWIYGIVLGTTDNGTFPLENALVNVKGVSGQMVDSKYTDSNGFYSVSSIDTGIYTVDASKDGYMTSIAINVVVESGQGTEVDFDLPEAPAQDDGWIYGTVSGTTDNGTFPLEDALVTVRASSGQIVDSRYTDSNGFYGILSVESGTYTVDASKDGYMTSIHINVVVDSGQGTEVDFDLPEAPAQDTCYIYGTVFVKSGNSTIPLANATVSYRSIENETNGSYQFWWVKLTDEEGNYLIELSPDVYELRAGRMRPSSPIEIVEVNANEKIRLDFILDEDALSVDDKPIGNYNDTVLFEAIQQGHVGGEITIWQGENKSFQHEIMIYNGVKIPQLDVEAGKVSFIVSGDENSTGKTIAINVDSSVFDVTSEIVVEYDGELIEMADDINDVLNPNDDGSHPEYLITIGANGTQLLVSIPHFSEHSIAFLFLISVSILSLSFR